MLEVILAHINTQIETLEHFKTLKSLCEIIKKEDISFPAEYCTKDEYKQIELDSVVYHRLTGEVTQSEIEDEEACAIQVTRTYPLRVVFTIPKNILNTDNNFIDLKIAENIVKVIGLKNSKTLNSSLKTDVVSVIVKSYSIDREKIWSEEYNNLPMTVDYKLIYGAIEYDVVIQGTQSCFNTYECND